MNKNLRDELSQIELEVKCNSCDGVGRWKEEGSGRARVCGRCDGSGYIMTEFGEKILVLIRHNFTGLMDLA